MWGIRVKSPGRTLRQVHSDNPMDMTLKDRYLHLINMVLYNVTNKVDKHAVEEWLDFMKNTHIPEVMATGHFIGYRICRLLDQPDDDDPTYVIQYECASLHKLNHYQLHNAPALREDLNKRFKDKYVAFRTVMEII